jgi:hypothetical protein
MPDDLIEAVQARVGRSGFSDYVTKAVAERDRIDRLGELSAYLEAEFGPIPPEIRAQTRREWPGYDGE